MSHRPFLITLSPIRLDAALTLTRAGETLVVNGLPLDLSGLAEGACRAADSFGCDALVSDVTCADGMVRLTLLLPHGSEATQAVLFPAPLTLTADGPVVLRADGPVALPG